MKRKLAFLSRKKLKTIRTVLYEDSLFHPFELEILHTPIFQRLYGLKQLGFADKVYPDAVHSRFNHVLGVCDRVEKMANQLVHWLGDNPDAVFLYGDKSQTSGELADHVKQNTKVVRLVGLLHDITHAAFGHTLEDEIGVFAEKHDDPARQARFLNCLVAQLVWNWAYELGMDGGEPDSEVMAKLERNDIDEDDILARARFIGESIGPDQRAVLSAMLKELDYASSLLFKLDVLHHPKDPGKSSKRKEKALAPLPVTILPKIIRTFETVYSGTEFDLHRDAIFIDMVGNTVCADLLDYARRDPLFSGLRANFDDRIMRYHAAVSDGIFSPTEKPCIRLAVQFYTTKMRHDVLSEMSKILKARYLISESILWHPTKCAAGAMLGSAIQLLGLDHLPKWTQTLTDGEFLSVLSATAKNLTGFIEETRKLTPSDDVKQSILRLWPSNEDARELVQCALRGLTEEKEPTFSSIKSSIGVIQQRVSAARLTLWQLSGRRFPTLVFRLRSQVEHSEKESAKALAERYGDQKKRYELERQVERRCGLPVGTIFVHCPPRKTSMKVAEALVVGPDLSKVAHLRDLTQVAGKHLQPYEDEVRAIERMYESIWTFHIYLATAHLDKALLVASVVHRLIDYPNDDLLVAELTSDDDNPYDLLATELKHEFAFNDLEKIVVEIDRSAANSAQAHAEDGGVKHQIDEAIRTVSLSKADVGGQRPSKVAKSKPEKLEREKQIPLIPASPISVEGRSLLSVEDIVRFAALFGANKLPAEAQSELRRSIQEFLIVPNKDESGYDRRRRLRFVSLLEEMQDIDPKKNRYLNPKEIMDSLRKLWAQTDRE